MTMTPLKVLAGSAWAGMILLCLFPPREGVTVLIGQGRNWQPPRTEYRGHYPFWETPGFTYHNDEYTTVVVSPTVLALEVAGVHALAFFAAACAHQARAKAGARTAAKSA